MALSLNIEESIKVELGEMREELLYDLEQGSIRYSIPFDKTNEQDIKETIIQIPDLGIEISVENDIVTYIKSGCNEFNQLAELELGKLVNISTVEDIKKQIIDRFKLDAKSMFIEKVNMRAMEMVIVVKDEMDEKCRIHIMSDSRGRVYINTIRYMK